MSRIPATKHRASARARTRTHARTRLYHETSTVTTGWADTSVASASLTLCVQLTSGRHPQPMLRRALDICQCQFSNSPHANRQRTRRHHDSALPTVPSAATSNACAAGAAPAPAALARIRNTADCRCAVMSLTLNPAEHATNLAKAGSCVAHPGKHSSTPTAASHHTYIRTHEDSQLLY
jgi:hypothetical protein